MKVYTFGNKQNKCIMLIPGTCCHWKKTFGEIIPLLEKDYFVNVVSFSGFDETTNDIFISMLDETKKIEDYIKENLNGTVDLVYGSSLGGSFVGLLIQRGNIHINHGIIGSSDMDQDSILKAKLKCKIAIPLLYKIVSTGEYPKILKKKIEQKRTPFRDKFMKMFGIGKGGLNFIKKESIYNQFYSDLTTPLDENIDMDNTKIHIFYAKKMGHKYLERYKKHFKNPDIIEYDLEHEELLIMYPEKFVEEIKKVAVN